MRLVCQPPTAGEAGGAPSGSKNYYSFDYGDVHVVSLDSYYSNRGVSGAMLSWLRRDLDQLTSRTKWLIAFW